MTRCTSKIFLTVQQWLNILKRTRAEPRFTWATWQNYRVLVKERVKQVKRLSEVVWCILCFDSWCGSNITFQILLLLLLLLFQSQKSVVVTTLDVELESEAQILWPSGHNIRSQIKRTSVMKEDFLSCFIITPQLNWKLIKLMNCHERTFTFSVCGFISDSAALTQRPAAASAAHLDCCRSLDTPSCWESRTLMTSSRLPPWWRPSSCSHSPVGSSCWCLITPEDGTEEGDAQRVKF